MYEEIIEDATEKSPLVLEAARQISQRTAQMRKDQQAILESFKIDHDLGTYDDLSAKNLRDTAQSSQTQSLEQIKLFNAQLSSTDFFQLRFNKMALIVEQTIQLFSHKSFTHHLSQGLRPNIFDYETTYIPIQGSINFWGNNDATIFSNALIGMRLALHPQESIQQYMHTAIAHVIPATLPEGYATSRYAYNHDGKTGFGVVHGGYAFGGQRLENVFAPKKFGPEDCSSWVAKLTKSATEWSTQDLLCAYRKLTDNGIVPAGWDSSVLGQEYRTTYETTVKPENIQPGDIYLSRSFNTAFGDPDTNLGSGGHTGVVVNADPNNPGRVLIFGFNRDMERQNKSIGAYGVAGAGIESRPRFDHENTQTKYLRLKV